MKFAKVAAPGGEAEEARDLDWKTSDKTGLLAEPWAALSLGPSFTWEGEALGVWTLVVSF